jgi:hypothetical protein
VATATAASNGFRIHPAVSTSSALLTGDGYSGIYIWGAQLEAGAFATSYIPTTTAQVTRSADAASMTGANFSSWYRADEGTLYSEAATFDSVTNSNMVVSLSDGSTNNIVQQFYASATTIRSQFNYAGVAQAQLNQSGVAVGSQYKIASSYKVDDFSSSVNAQAVQTDTNGNLPAGVNQMGIGNRLGSILLNGTIKKLAFYPDRLSNAQLQALTQN